MTDIKALLQQQSPQTPKQSVSLSGYGAPAQMQNHLSVSMDIKKLATMAGDILADPQALGLFSDRVYDYLKRDMALQQERSGFSSRRLM
jgi:hypothetical protein